MSKRKPWTRNQKLIFWGLMITGIGAITPFAVRFVPQWTRMDKEEIEKIVEKAISDHLEKHGEDLQGYRPDRDQLKAELTKALERTNSLAVTGNRTDAEKALNELRERGDMSSLQQMLIMERNKNRDMLVERNHEIAAVAYLRGDMKIASSASQEILRLDPNDPIALMQMGHIYVLQGKLGEAEKKYLRVHELGINVNNEKWQADALGNLGLIYRRRGDLDKAEQMHLKSLEIEKRIGQLDGMAAEYANLGAVYLTRGDLDKAEQMHNRSLEIYKNLGWLEGMAGVYGNLGVIYLTRGDLDKAEQMHNKSLEIEEKLGRLEGLASVYGNLGAIYLTRGDLDKAEQMHNKSLEINEKLGRFEGMARQYGNLGLICQKRDELDEAREYGEKALELFRSIGMKPEIEKAQGWIDGLNNQIKRKKGKG